MTGLQVAFLIGKSIHTCPNTSYNQWAEEWIKGNRSARLTFKSKENEDEFWEEFPEAAEAYKAAKEIEK